MTESNLLTSQIPAAIQRAATPAEVENAVRNEIPEFKSGQFVLDEVGLSWRLRKEEELWRGTLRVTWRESADSEPKMTRVPAVLTLDERDVGPQNVPFGSPGWSGHLNSVGISMACEVDEGLPELPMLLDPQQSIEILTPILRQTRPELPQINDCTPNILRYKHGSRCTIGYALEPEGGPSESVPNPVIAKTYAGIKGQIAHEAMDALWNSELQGSTNVHIAEPLGYDTESSLLLQGPVPGDEILKSVILDWFADGTGSLDRIEGLVRATARGLADLHLATVTVGEQRVWQTDLDELTSRRDRVVDVMPAVETYGAELIAKLEAMDKASGPLPLVPTHGSFRAAQVLVDGDEVSFIDFDSFCQAEPALDVAEFAFRLEQMALVKTGPNANGTRTDTEQKGLEVQRLSDAFLEEYQAMAPVDNDRIALWWTVGALSLVFSSFIKLKLARVPACLSLVDRAVERFDLG